MGQISQRLPVAFESIVIASSPSSAEGFIPLFVDLILSRLILAAGAAVVAAVLQPVPVAYTVVFMGLAISPRSGRILPFKALVIANSPSSAELHIPLFVDVILGGLILATGVPVVAAILQTLPVSSPIVFVGLAIPMIPVLIPVIPVLIVAAPILRVTASPECCDEGKYKRHLLPRIHSVSLCCAVCSTTISHSLPNKGLILNEKLSGIFTKGHIVVENSP
jgi:hypothetical protein